KFFDGRSSMTKRWFQRFFAVTVLVAPVACMSKIDHMKDDHSRKGAAIPLDFSKIYLTNLDSGEEVSILSYMQVANKDHLLLLFGSVGCTSCKEKSDYLVKNVLDRDKGTFANLTEPAFEVAGVNVDPKDSLDLVERERKNFFFIHWLDPEGNVMQN